MKKNGAEMKVNGAEEGVACADLKAAGVDVRVICTPKGTTDGTDGYLTTKFPVTDEHR
ncbi:MAG: hypothetical protein JXD23_04340 [Spirochaetales bacterium]|nr:hypothetical protein [Spirochaetales bacterium]